MKKLILLNLIFFSSLVADQSFDLELKRIIERAEKLWPTDYVMQNYESKKQVEAYKKMIELKKGLK